MDDRCNPFWVINAGAERKYRAPIYLVRPPIIGRERSGDGESGGSRAGAGRAGEIGGARAERLSWRRIAETPLGSVIVAISFMRPWHCGHSRTCFSSDRVAARMRSVNERG